MTTMDELTTPCELNFCPGCGNFGIWAAFKQAAVKEGWDASNTVITAGIGCHGHMMNFIKLPAFESLHGRSLPIATGIKMANHKLNVFAFTGDGDCLAEGGNHFIHTCRRNHDITIILHDNAIYGLTTGQTSPRTPHGFKTKSTPDGNLDTPFNPCALAITSGATFVARTYFANQAHLIEMLIQANRHPGTAFIDVLQTCVTFNKEYSQNFYQDNIYMLDDNYDPTNKLKAYEKALEWGEKQIPLGLIYKEDKPSYEAQVTVIKDKPLIATEPSKKDVSAIFKTYM